MARGHVRNMLQGPERQQVVVVCEPSAEAYESMAQLFREAGQPVPPNQPDLARMLDEYASQVEVAFIVTPHAFHHRQAKMCLEAGLDVPLEKPMVMNTAEAVDLGAPRDPHQCWLV